MKLTHPPDKRPQDPHMNGAGLRFETLDHGGEYPDTMPQAIKLIGVGAMDAGRYAYQIRGTSRGPRWAALLLGLNHHGALGAIPQYRSAFWVLHSALGCMMIHLGRNARTEGRYHAQEIQTEKPSFEVDKSAICRERGH